MHTVSRPSVPTPTNFSMAMAEGILVINRTAVAARGCEV